MATVKYSYDESDVVPMKFFKKGSYIYFLVVDNFADSRGDLYALVDQATFRISSMFMNKREMASHMTFIGLEPMTVGFYIK